LKNIQNLGIVAILALSAIGCNDTAEGVKNDTRDNSINASSKLKEGLDSGANMAKDAANEASNAGKDMSAAAQLTPRIKNAINADPLLNSDGNRIDVDSTKEAVTLTGHVLSEELKEKASKIAKEELTKAKAGQKLVNELSVEAPKK
jgi:osmotically-inducible protein OsmY